MEPKYVSFKEVVAEAVATYKYRPTVDYSAEAAARVVEFYGAGGQQWPFFVIWILFPYL